MSLETHISPCLHIDGDRRHPVRHGCANTQTFEAVVR